MRRLSPLLLSVLFLVLSGCCADLSKEGGTRMSNNMETYATTYIQEHKILEEGEKVIAYYDVTLALDGTEAAIVTNQRVIYHKSGDNTAFKLTDIESINHKEEFGTHITVVDKEGQRMSIEVAPLNGGPEFLNALEDGHRRAQDKAADQP